MQYCRNLRQLKEPLHQKVPQQFCPHLGCLFERQRKPLILEEVGFAVSAEELVLQLVFVEGNPAVVVDQIPAVAGEEIPVAVVEVEQSLVVVVAVLAVVVKMNQSVHQ